MFVLNHQPEPLKSQQNLLLLRQENTNILNVESVLTMMVSHAMPIVFYNHYCSICHLEVLLFHPSIELCVACMEKGLIVLLFQVGK